MTTKIYAQIYSLLRTNKAGLLDALRTLSEIGYDGFEGIGPNTGGLPVEEFRQFVADLKLDPISFHALKTEADLEFAQHMGARFLDVRTPEHIFTRAEVVAAAESVNKVGLKAAQYGLKPVIHNHATEFQFLSDEPGVRIYDVYLENTDPELVGFELDCGWAQFAGIDSAAYIRKYPGRFPLLHIKECDRLAISDEEMAHFPREVMALGTPTPDQPDLEQRTDYTRGFSLFSVAQARLLYSSRTWNVGLGQGLVDWKAISDAAGSQGVQAYINEREFYDFPGGHGDPVTCARLDFGYLKSL